MGVLAAFGPRGASPEQPQDAPFEASLTVRLSAGKSTYAMGELIPLDLEFTGKASEDFYWSTESYDRSGRMASETYELEPRDGFTDPLYDYFHGGIFGFIGGGLRGWRALDGSLFRVHVTLNEWVRFTKPGRYELAVSSGRLQRYSGQPAPRVRAAPIEFVIVPAGESWAAGEVNLAASAIEGGGRAAEGIAILRHLGTKEAALALVEHYTAIDKQASFDLFAGLIASPHRAFIVEAMEAKIDAGEPVPADYIRRLSYLQCLLQMPRGTGDYRARQARHAALERDYDTRWMAASTRLGPTSEALGAALGKLTADVDGEVASTIADTLARHPKEAAAAFLALPSVEQGHLLRYRWSPLNRPWIRSVLDTLYARWTGGSEGSIDAGNIALERLVELDPETGRRLVLDEIVTGHHRIGFDALAVLPGTTPPNLDTALRLRFERHRIGDPHIDEDARKTTAWLMWQYGSPGLVPFVTSLLDGPRRSCAVEAALLAYLLKHEPEPALRRLRPGPGRSPSSICALRELAARVWDERIESAAIAHLASQDSDEAADAAQVLGEYGSAQVLAPLMERFGRWEAEWHGKGGELEALRPRPGPSPERIENALTNALFDNKQITLSTEDEARVRALCVTDSCRSNADGRMRTRRE
jgi:hypothetical protein